MRVATVPATTSAHEQEGGRVGVQTPSIAVPQQPEALAGARGCITAAASMHPAVMLGQSIDTRRHEHAPGAAGASRLTGLECLGAGDRARPGERAHTCLLLGSEAQHRVPRREKLLHEMAQRATRRVARRGVTTRQDCGALAPGHPERLAQAADQAGASTDAVGVPAVGHRLGRPIRPQPVVTPGVAGDPFFARGLPVLEPGGVCGCRLLPSASWLAHTRARRIIGQWRELSEACLDGVRSAAQEVRNVWGPTMAQGERFDGRKAAAVLCRAALVVLPHQRCDVRSVVRLKVKRHAGSSRSQVLPAMGGADHEVFMNRNRNARAHALGIYFGAMPYLHSREGSRRAVLASRPFLARREKRRHDVIFDGTNASNMKKLEGPGRQWNYSRSIAALIEYGQFPLPRSGIIGVIEGEPMVMGAWGHWQCSDPPRRGRYNRVLTTNLVAYVGNSLDKGVPYHTYWPQ